MTKWSSMKRHAGDDAAPQTKNRNFFFFFETRPCRGTVLIATAFAVAYYLNEFSHLHMWPFVPLASTNDLHSLLFIHLDLDFFLRKFYD